MFKSVSSSQMVQTHGNFNMHRNAINSTVHCTTVGILRAFLLYTCEEVGLAGHIYDGFWDLVSSQESIQTL